MAKRFTDSTKWNDNWFFNLTNEEKLAWIYILDTCDHAGIWEKNMRLLNFQIGSNLVENKLKEVFEGKFIEIKDKWFIPNFIRFQYGNTFLTSNTPAVKSARERLIDIGFVKVDINGNLTLIQQLNNPCLTLTEGLDKSSETLKDKDKDMDEDKSEDRVIVKDVNMDENINKIKDMIMDIFKDERVVRYLDKKDMDAIERIDKYNFNLHYNLLLEYNKLTK